MFEKSTVQYTKPYLRRFFLFTFLISVIVGAFGGGVFGFLGATALDNLVGPQGLLEMPSFLTSQTQKEVPMTNEEALTIEATRKVNPSVVSIALLKTVTDTMMVDPFFFGELPPQIVVPPGGAKQDKQEVASGSGFIISADGLILTNRHVIEEPAEYRVQLFDGRKFTARLIAKDPLLDLAVLKIDATGLRPVETGDSDQIQLGQTVIAIGNSLSEFSNTVTRGIVSGRHRRVVAGGASGQSEVLEEAIQTDAAINPGNSGGPLINLAGQVIGINTAVSNRGQSIGFAIPINTAKQIIQSVKQYGRLVRPWLGVRYVILNPDIAAANKLQRDYGALIVPGDAASPAIVKDSPAEKAGLKENDIILEVNGVKITEQQSISGEIIKYRPGETITLKVFRDGKEILVKVFLTEFKDQTVSATSTPTK